MSNAITTPAAPIPDPNKGHMTQPKGVGKMPDLTGLIAAVRLAFLGDAEAGDGLEEMAKNMRPGPDGIPCLPRGVVRTPKGPVRVFAVDGHYVQLRVNADFGEGDNSEHARQGAGKKNYMPPMTIWVDGGLQPELWFPVIVHEDSEMIDMQGGMLYQPAHERALGLEHQIRAMRPQPGQPQGQPAMQQPTGQSAPAGSFDR